MIEYSCAFRIVVAYQSHVVVEKEKEKIVEASAKYVRGFEYIDYGLCFSQEHRSLPIWTIFSVYVQFQLHLIFNVCSEKYESCSAFSQ